MRKFSLSLLVLFLALLTPHVCSGQLLVNDMSSTFTSVRNTTGGVLTDAALDQQTGQPDSDFVGSAAIPGFLVKGGTFGGVDALMFRATLNTYNSNLTNFNMKFGFDANNDGIVDLYFGYSKGSGSNPDVLQFFKGSGVAGKNVSPSTTDMSILAANTVTVTTGGSANFGYLQVASNFSDGTTGTQDDAQATFILTLAQINSALTAISMPSINTSSSFLFVAITSTQNSSVNQDAYGVGSLAGTGGDVRWDSLIGRIDGSGNVVSSPSPVPEPSTFIGCGFMLTIGGLLWHRRRRMARSAGV